MNTKKTPTITPKDRLFSIEARSQSMTLRSYEIGALPIINRICERMKLEEFLDEYLPCDRRWKISVAKGIRILIANILISREPMYGVGEWASTYAPDLLGITDKQIPSLNDDRIGRCLDRLFDSGYASLLLALVSHVVEEFDVELDQLHNDSTTITFFGKYEQAIKGRRKRGKPTKAVTWGHNKDHRPDLKQLLFLLTISADGGIPIHFDAADGNTTDDMTHLRTWNLLRKLTGRADFLYVADSKLATSENMTAIAGAGGRFISILPRSRLEHRVFHQELQDRQIHWEEVYRVADEDEPERPIELYQVARNVRQTKEGFRLLWFHSVQKQFQDRQARLNRVQRTLDDLKKLQSRVESPRTRFKDKEKVVSAVEKILDDRSVHDLVSYGITELEEEVYRQASAGRPSKSTRYVRQVKQRFKLTFEPDTAGLAAASIHDGVFPLVSNVKDMDGKAILLAYKKQPVVERRYWQLKNDFEVAPVFLKEVARIEALTCVYFLAMLVQSLLERELRQAMDKSGHDSLSLYPEWRECRSPTSRRVLDIFGNVQRHVVVKNEIPGETLVTDLSKMQRFVLALLKVDESSMS